MDAMFSFRQRMVTIDALCGGGNELIFVHVSPPSHTQTHTLLNRFSTKCYDGEKGNERWVSWATFHFVYYHMVLKYRSRCNLVKKVIFHLLLTFLLADWVEIPMIYYSSVCPTFRSFSLIALRELHWRPVNREKLYVPLYILAFRPWLYTYTATDVIENWETYTHIYYSINHRPMLY